MSNSPTHLDSRLHKLQKTDTMLILWERFIDLLNIEWTPLFELKDTKYDPGGCTFETGVFEDIGVAVEIFQASLLEQEISCCFRVNEVADAYSHVTSS